jgi:tripartite ATP-independent transporter DctP family solute receptor
MRSRRELLLGLGALGVSCMAGRQAAAAAALQLKAADVHIDDYPTVAAVRWMGERLRERTAGRLDVQVYHSGQLGRESDTVELVRFGALDITRVNFAAVNNPFPLTRVFSLPYVFDSVGHMRRAVDGAAGQAVLQSFASRGLVGLAIYDAGSRCIYNTRRAIHEPGDLHGLKLRVPPSDIFIDMVRALGGNPTPLPFGESYSALQTHLIEGAENNWRTFHTSRHFEVARYWSASHHSYSPEALVMSRARFDALSMSDQDTVLRTASESVPYMRGLWDAMEAQSEAVVRADGVTVNEVEVSAFQRVVQPLLKNYLRDEQLARVYQSIREVG